VADGTVEPVEQTAAAELLAGIATRDFTRIETCFAPDAVLRALTPHQLREEHGPPAIAGQYRSWLDSLSDFEVLAADAERIADRVRIRYRFRGRDRAKGWQENEHTAYAEFSGDAIVALNLSCAGFRPAGPTV
jgi:hypothetical protein